MDKFKKVYNIIFYKTYPRNGRINREENIDFFLLVINEYIKIWSETLQKKGNFSKISRKRLQRRKCPHASVYTSFDLDVSSANCHAIDLRSRFEATRELDESADFKIMSIDRWIEGGVQVDAFQPRDNATLPLE